MKFEPFRLERWLETRPCKYNLGGGPVRPMDMLELVEKVDLVAAYPPTKGSEKLREEISELYRHVEKDSILVTNGTAEANFLIANWLLDEGDEVVVQIPSYQQVWGITRAIGARVKRFHLIEEEGYKPDLEELKELVSSKTKAIFIINPNNPTGYKLSKDETQSICDVADDVGAYVIYDEAYRGTELDGFISPSPPEVYEKGISTTSLSKLGLPGLRIGWIVANEETVEGCWSYKDYVSLSHSKLTEKLATIALQTKNFEKIIKRARRIIRTTLEIFSSWMADHNEFMSWVEPTAGTVAFPRYHLHFDSVSFCEKLLKEEGILLSPGDFFQSPKHVRVHFAGHDEKVLTRALDKLHTFLNRHTVAN
ncbi:MAG: aminotransferase class I/II-fold pyridoxal phosphate-dependent enzyme [Nitrososphaeria archaeon]|nr:aminotransferase class I/II-fold pyridoxal phosphate-dependent enzyme [Nitrososphaeria archaeon]NIN53117.1 aminotransferase class I/II-fold pyridoxal phosphate-dependent enzyme [Nitrososphaeria archaeon]NIQ33883.1 aminotransferase class I/II-fold pyridoxal phosphate-dependent enzyme [Nitrososphaeria archaeon]